MSSTPASASIRSQTTQTTQSTSPYVLEQTPTLNPATNQPDPSLPVVDISKLTPEQQKAAIELKRQLEELGFVEDLSAILRFLRARKYDVAKSREMYMNYAKWKSEFGVDTILEDFHYTEKPLVAKLYPCYYHKTDKDGRPVYFEELGKVDLNKMLKITTQDRMLHNLVWEYEAMVKYRLPACSRRAGYLVETSCTVLDLSGISITSAYNVIGYVKEASKIGQDYYPERMGKFYLINAPFGFSTAFKLFKPFLDPVTVSKIHILGYSYAKELLKQIPIENLPTKYGGKSDVTDDELLLKDVGPWREAEFIGPEGECPKVFDI
ncbi:SEC14 SEC14 cytosolic factor [Candida maltosa Xu316]|uniref:SEC14 cytosolic factor n=1 Tax=Candida maltosa (strain Xu316) TaxID=1245528 RepID=M3JTW0_CANMX|nr:SEC14 cytosolic factor [Candida maltosa Xu316]